MSKLNELLNGLCPDGVEYVKLNTICKIYDGTHSTPEYKESGIKFVSVENINNLYSTQKYISEEAYKKYKIKPQINDVLMTRIGSIGVCTVVDRDEPLAYYVSLALLRPEECINSRFLKYAIESLNGRKELRKRTLVNAVPIKINKDDIGLIKVPVPPLEVQREIVRVLDSFTLLTAELTAELTARKKQYAYYKEILLNNKNESEVVSIQDICNISRGKVISKGDISDNVGDYPVYSSQTENDGVLGRISSYMYDGEYLTWTTDGANAGTVFYRKGKFNITNVCGLLDVNKEKVNIRYLFHALSVEAPKYVNKGMGNPKLMSNVMGNIKICIPSLEKQRDIADILDSFDVMCSSLNSGLPAEIEARRKQYEYYRDKIMNFKAKEQ